MAGPPRIPESLCPAGTTGVKRLSGKREGMKTMDVLARRVERGLLARKAWAKHHHQQQQQQQQEEETAAPTEKRGIAVNKA